MLEAKKVSYKNDFEYLAEAFVSIQGEGVHQGQNSLFIRLQGCNLRCAFCDTKETWKLDDKRVERKTTQEMFDAVDYFVGQGFKFKNIIITGGEPLLQWNSIWDFFKHFELPHRDNFNSYKHGSDIFYRNFDFVIETNGTLLPGNLGKPGKEFGLFGSIDDPNFNLHFSISPKFFAEQKTPDAEITSKSFMLLNGINNTGIDFIAKFVVDMSKFEEDMSLVEQLCKINKINAKKVYIQPMGITTDSIEVEKDYLDKIVEAGYHISPRLHILYNLK